MFLAKHTFVKFTKSQIQDKEKDLKRDYKALKEARKQSGAGWCEETHKLQDEPHLWEKRINGIGDRLKKLKKKSFPLYDALGDLYDGHLAEGNLNFTSTAGPSTEAMESDDDECQLVDQVNIAKQGEVNTAQEFRDHLEDELVDAAQRLRDQGESEQGDSDERNKEEVGDAEKKKSPLEQLRYDAAERKKAQLEQKRKAIAAGKAKTESSEGLVGVMKRFVDIKEKEALKEEAMGLLNQ